MCFPFSNFFSMLFPLFKGNSIFTFFWISDTMCQELIVACSMSEKSIWKWGNKFTCCREKRKERKLLLIELSKSSICESFRASLLRAIIQLLKSHSTFSVSQPRSPFQTLQNTEKNIFSTSRIYYVQIFCGSGRSEKKFIRTCFSVGSHSHVGFKLC